MMATNNDGGISNSLGLFFSKKIVFDIFCPLPPLHSHQPPLCCNVIPAIAHFNAFFRQCIGKNGSTVGHKSLKPLV